MGNNSAPPKWSKLWIDTPQPSDHIGAWSRGKNSNLHTVPTGLIRDPWIVDHHGSPLEANAKEIRNQSR
jgi:hypothetical protein